jgi:hypothetical protein
MPGKTGCAPQKLICHFTDRLIQPQLWLTHQEPITVGVTAHNNNGVDPQTCQV